MYKEEQRDCYQRWSGRVQASMGVFYFKNARRAKRITNIGSSVEWGFLTCWEDGKAIQQSSGEGLPATNCQTQLGIFELLAANCSTCSQSVNRVLWLLWIFLTYVPNSFVCAPMTIVCLEVAKYFYNIAMIHTLLMPGMSLLWVCCWNYVLHLTIETNCLILSQAAI